MPRRKPTKRVRAEDKPNRKRRWSQDVRAAARRLFVEEGLSYLDVGARLDVPESTVRKWSKDGHWELSREEMAGSTRSLYEMAQKILRNKLQQIEKLDPDQVTTAMLDGLQKLMNTVQAARETVRLLEAAVVTGEEFVSWVRREIPDEATRSVVYDAWHRFLDYAKEA